MFTILQMQTNFPPDDGVHDVFCLLGWNIQRFDWLFSFTHAHFHLKNRKMEDCCSSPLQDIKHEFNCTIWAISGIAYFHEQIHWKSTTWLHSDTLIMSVFQEFHANKEKFHWVMINIKFRCNLPSIYLKACFYKKNDQKNVE